MPSKLRSITAGADTATANARVAQETAPYKITQQREQAAQAPIATQSAQVGLDQQRVEAPLRTNLLRTQVSSANYNNIAQKVAGFHQSLALANAGDLEGAKYVAQQYGETFPEAVLTNARLRGQITALAEEAKARYPTNPQKQQQYLAAAMKGLSDATLGDANTASPTYPYQVPGVPEADTSTKPAETMFNPQGIGTGDASAAATISGDEYLKTLQPNIQTQVKALTDGRMAFPTGFALRSPYWQNMLQAVAQYDPSFDAINYNTRSKTRSDFTSGKAATNITALNTAIGHLNTLDDAATAMGNTSMPLVNSAKNFALSNTGDPRTNNFNIARNAVSNELTRVFRGTGGSEADVQAWKENINNAASPAQMRGAIAQAVNLLHSRIEALDEQYKRGMGPSSTVLDLLTPEARHALTKINSDTGATPTNETGAGGH